MTRSRCAIGLGALILLGSTALVTAAEETLAIRGGAPHEWIVTYQGRPVCVYTYAPEQRKPYVRELCTPDGVNVLRDSPADHLHHHALMYAVRVDGVNFWEEAPGSGVEKPVAVLESAVKPGPDGRPKAIFRQRIHWVAEADASRTDTEPVALLIEDRTLTVTVAPQAREVALRWQGAFRPGPGRERVTLTGSNYNGLGARFRQDLDSHAVHLVDGQRIDHKGRPNVVTPGSWAAVQFDTPDAPSTFALFNAPGNTRVPAHFFTMVQPFAYLAATQALDREPLVYEAGQSFAVDYLVTVHPEIQAADALNRRAAAWSASVSAPAAP